MEYDPRFTTSVSCQSTIAPTPPPPLVAALNDRRLAIRDVLDEARKRATGTHEVLFGYPSSTPSMATQKYAADRDQYGSEVLLSGMDELLDIARGLASVVAQLSSRLV